MWLQRLQAHRILINIGADGWPMGYPVFGWIATPVAWCSLRSSGGPACCGVVCPSVCWVSCLLNPLALVSKFTLIGVVSSFSIIELIFSRAF